MPFSKELLVTEFPALQVCNILPSVGLNYFTYNRRCLFLGLSTWHDINIPNDVENLIINTAHVANGSRNAYWTRIMQASTGIIHDKWDLKIRRDFWESHCLYNLNQTVQPIRKDQSSDYQKKASLPVLELVLKVLNPTHIIAFSGKAVYDWLRDNHSEKLPHIFQAFANNRILRIGPHPSYPNLTTHYYNSAIKEFLEK